TVRSRLRSRRAASSGEICSASPASRATGSATFRSAAASTSYTHSSVARSVPDGVRKKTTRLRSGATVKRLGAPRVNSCVRAERRGKLGRDSRPSGVAGSASVVSSIGSLTVTINDPDTGASAPGLRVELMQPARRVLFVHAHPDDETIGNGATMAKYAAEGVAVTNVTCTRGELGEILVPELEHLAADRDDRLGEHRVKEMADAMAALGVTDFRWLGGEGKYRDSGMMGTPGNDAPTCFWRADLLEAATDL